MMKKNHSRFLTVCLTLILSLGAVSPAHAFLAQMLGGAIGFAVADKLIKDLPITPFEVENPSFKKADEFLTEGKNKKAFKIYKDLAEQGLPEAQHRLGLLYSYGAGTKKNLTEAMTWYLKSAQAGLKEGAFELAVLLSEGKNVAHDEVLAFQWMERAHQMGEVRASSWLANFYYHGRGTVKNIEMAANLAELGAKQGDALSQLLIGLYYARGHGRAQDRSTATYWLGLAANQDVPKAKSLLKKVSAGESV